MKVTTTHNTEFKPIQLEITVESKAELRELIMLFSRDITVPDYIYQHACAENNLMSYLMSSIGQELRKHETN